MESSEDDAEVESASEFSETEAPLNKEQYVTDTFDGIDPACCECDDGGTVHSCDGGCLRSFHFGLMVVDVHPPEASSEAAVKVEDGEESIVFGHSCNPLDMPEDLAMRFEQLKDKAFKCPNCLAHRHRCYACNTMGDSDLNHPFSQDTVARCVVLNCGKFYHPRCISTPEHAVLTSDHMETLAFVCPQHFCAARAENKCVVPPEREREEAVIPCRRCPRAYHQECIPRKLFNQPKGRKGAKRVWIAKADAKPGKDGVPMHDPVDRSLIYCERHPIPKNRDNPELSAPLFTKQLISTWRRHYSKLYKDLPSSAEWLANNPRLQPGQSEAQDKEEEEPPLWGSSQPRKGSAGAGKSRETSKARASRDPSTAPPVRKKKRNKKTTAQQRAGRNNSLAGSMPTTSCQDNGEGDSPEEVKVKEEEPLPAQEAGVEPDDRASTTPAQEAAKTRLDVLYRVFQMFQNRARRNDGYTTLTRGSLEAIFDRLIESYDFSDKSVFVDLGAGIGRVLWHASFTVNSTERPVGIEMSTSLQAEAEELEQMVRDGANEAPIATPDWEYGAPEISFQEISSFSAHDYATHVFIFWDGFTPESKQAAFQIFCKSEQACLLVVVQPGEDRKPTVVLGFDGSNITLAETIAQGIQVEGSNEPRVAYIYQKAPAPAIEGKPDVIGSSTAQNNVGESLLCSEEPLGAHGPSPKEGA